jgi:predicted XRE-type DNA-binding protein
MEDKLEVQDQFVELRAKGNSYDKIASTLGVSKSTLLSWSKDLSMAIDNERNVAMDAIYEKHKLAKQHQMEMLGIQLSNVRSELEKRDLSEVSTDKLLAMQMKLLDAVNSSGVSVVFRAESEGWAISLGEEQVWNG